MVEEGLFHANHGFGAGLCGERAFEENAGTATDRRAVRQRALLPLGPADERPPPSMDTEAGAKTRSRNG